MKKITISLLAILSFSLNLLAQQSTNANPDNAKIVTSDIDLFWKAYDKATPENNLNVFRDEYLRKGSVGLKDFTKLRIGNVCNLVGTMETAPKYYAALREPSLKIASYENQMRTNFRKLKEIYPDSVFPDVYFVIGRMSSGGTTSENGLLIGVEMYGRNEGVSLEGLSDWHKAVLSSTDKIPYIVAHELIHYEQKTVAQNSLLARSIREGSADFIGELISGGNINAHLHKYGNPIEKQLWIEFKKEMNGTNLDNWLYQGDKAKGKPADLGYYMGYKICESYYKNAADKKQAVKDILEIKDFSKFLADSKYEEKFN
ncbi:MAG: DUF2268 domain-containing protein [Pyrinomonadaceae bacterium]|nr:DUF2268 domain-containing protein [Pyrinomonadaceae bacterium]